MKEIDTTERHWRDHLAIAEAAADRMAPLVVTGAVRDPAIEEMPHVLYHITKALAGLTAADPKLSRWQPMERLQPAPDPAADEHQRHLERAEGY